MEKQVIFRDRQELQSVDLNNIETYTAAAMQHLVQDAVSDDAWYTGLFSAAESTTEVSVGAGRFYNNGLVYTHETAQTLSLFQYLPLVTSKVVAVTVWGQQVETIMEPRDFLIDLTTGETQPQAVAMQRLNICNINPVAGAESVAPQVPAVPNNVLVVALVYLTPTGIDRVEMQTGMVLPNLADHAARVTTIETWKAKAEPRISSIATDLAALAGKTNGLATRESFIELSLDLARVKEQLNLPDSYSSYSSDGFGDEEESNPLAVGYAARIKNGLLFPLAGEAVAPIALFNPYDAGIIRHGDDLVLPKYTSQARISTTGYSGDVSISQYQTQSTELKKYERTVWDYHYGWNYNYYNGWYNQYYYYYWRFGRYNYWNYGYYTSRQEVSYELSTVTNSVQGAILAQTVLVPNSMWLTQVGLYLTQVGASGDMNVIICDTDAGKPVAGRALAHVVVPVASLKKYPEQTAVAIPPVLLEAGKRYAIMLITQGDHRAAVVSGNNYTQGTLFYGTDGDYMMGDLTKDLMFTMYGAQFERARTEIMLQSVSLAGGMSDIDISTPQVCPDGCEISYEVQIGGKWYPLTDNTMRLAGSPDIVPLRVVLLGTSDLAPGVEMKVGALVGTRPTTALVHYSKARTLSVPTTSIEVQVVVSQWEALHHTLECQVVSLGSTINPTATVWAEEPDGVGRRGKFSFTVASTSSYVIKLTGSRATGSAPFVVVERTDIAM